MESKSISVIIIDDEPDAINLLEMYLRLIPNTEVIGKELDGKKGIELVNTLSPDIIFLDIDMPEMNGLEVAGKLHSEKFCSEIVFTTAYEHYAYEAIDIEPLDFLTKPFYLDDLKTVFIKYEEKCKKKIQKRKLDLFIQSQESSPKIKLPSINGILIVELKEIVLIKSKINKTNLFLKDGSKELINKNLNQTIEILNSSVFFQINRSTFINLSFLQRIDKKNSKCVLWFNNNIHEEPISRSNLLQFDKLMIFPEVPFLK